MVKKLRRKFVLISMGALTLILVVMTVALNLANYIRIQRNADDLLWTLAINGGSFPTQGGFTDRGGSAASEGGSQETGGPVDPNRPSEAPGGANPPGGRTGGRMPRRELFRDSEVFGYNRTAETPFESRWFWVRLDESEAVQETNTAHIATIDEAAAVAMTQAVLSERVREKVLQEDAAGGTHGNYRFLVSVQEDGMLVVFLDRTTDYHTARLLFIFSLLIAAAMLLLMFLLVTLFSARAVAPTVEAFEKQKRFISDAGHELKTPLSVISADVDVMEMTGEKTEWTASIRDQVARMSQLIRDMLTLSRMEEERINVVFADVDLSAVTAKAAEPFFVVAKAAGKRYETEIEEGIHLQGDANALAQLTSLLSDNAVKYSDESGTIRLTLKKEARAIRFEVSNTCERLPEGNLDRLFDRFYRADASRNRGTGGFGIGLSVARAIAESHGGKIRAERDGDHIIRFVAEFPAK